MKILFISPLPPPTTGMSLACKAFFNDLSENGYNLKLIDLSKDTFQQGISSFARVIEVTSVIWRTASFGQSANFIYLTPSESIAGNLKDILIMAVLWRKLQCTYLHLHGGAGMRVLLSDRHPLLRRVNAWFLRRVAGVVVLGQRHVDIYAAFVSAKRIHVVKNFAPDEVFLSSEKLIEKWCKFDRLNVLFLSNLLPGKGYTELVDAIGRLPLDLANRYQFDFAGGFESKEAKQLFLSSIQTLPNVIYHGVVAGDKKRELFSQTHLFCLPTYYPYEGQPISILEAYASGCAVATTNHSGIFDVFTPAENGWEVVPGSSASLVEMLQIVAENPDVAKQIGQTNHAQADTLYRREKHLKSLRSSLGLGAV